VWDLIAQEFIGEPKISLLDALNLKREGIISCLQYSLFITRPFPSFRISNETLCIFCFLKKSLHVNWQVLGKGPFTSPTDVLRSLRRENAQRILDKGRLKITQPIQCV